MKLMHRTHAFLAIMTHGWHILVYAFLNITSGAYFGFKPFLLHMEEKDEADNALLGFNSLKDRQYPLKTYLVER